jgi:hypothetical protein
MRPGGGAEGQAVKVLAAAEGLLSSKPVSPTGEPLSTSILRGDGRVCYSHSSIDCSRMLHAVADAYLVCRTYNKSSRSTCHS